MPRDGEMQMKPPLTSDSDQKAIFPAYELPERTASFGIFFGIVVGLIVWGWECFFGRINSFDWYYKISLVAFVWALPFIGIYLFIRATKCEKRQSSVRPEFYEYTFVGKENKFLERIFICSRFVFLALVFFCITFATLGFFVHK